VKKPKPKTKREPLAARVTADNKTDKTSGTVKRTEAAKPPAKTAVNEHCWPASRGLPSEMRLLRFIDLKELGIVVNHPQLAKLIERQGFPVGRWLSNNAHVWTELEVYEWLDKRPRARPGPKKRFHKDQRDDLPPKDAQLERGTP
jgi:hypothetical protein